MSHIAEEYAKCLGVKIGRPEISEHFYPIVSDKYITLHTHKGIQSRDYSSWTNVISLLKSRLKDYDIIQIGSKDDSACKGVDYDLRGLTSLKNINYIIKNSSLHLCTNSFSLHISSLFDIPTVSIFSDMLPEHSGALWNKSSEFIAIQPDLKGKKPSYSRQETIKSIDTIKPEEIATKVLNALNIKHDLYNYETLNIGDFYKNSILEVVPDHAPPQGFIPNQVINLRCDYGLDQESFMKWMRFKVNLMSSKRINLNLINQLKKNIVAMTLFLEEDDFNEEYLYSLDSMGVKYTLVCRDKEKLSSIRFEFFDFNIEQYKLKTKKDLDFGEKICNNTFYHSNKILISNGKEYSCKAALDAGIEKTKEDQKIIDNDVFWEEVEHKKIYNYAKNKKK